MNAAFRKLWHSIPFLAGLAFLGLAVVLVAADPRTARAVGTDNTWVSLGAILAGRSTAAQTAPLFAASRNVLFATDSGGVFRSTDGGVTFAQINNGLADLRVTELAVSPRFEFDTVLFASTPTGFYRTANGGQAWVKVGGGLPDAEVTGVAFSPLFASDQVVFAATKGFGLFKSNDAGVTWAGTGTSGTTDLNYLGVQVTQGDFGGTIVVTWTEGRVFRSNNAGAAWTEKSSGLPSGIVIETLVLGPNFKSAGLAILGSRANGAYRTTNGGDAWSLAGLTDQGTVAAIAFSSDFGSDAKVFSGTANGGFFLSSDSGASWTEKNTGMSRKSVTALSNSNDFRTDRTIFAGGGRGGLFKSTDGGDNWVEVVAGLYTPKIQATGFSNNYAADGVIIIATQSGVFRSADRGLSWTDISSDLPARNVRAAAVSPNYAVDETIVVGLEREGIHRAVKSNPNRWTQHNVGIEGTRIKTDPRSFAPSPNFQFDLAIFVAGAGGVAKSVQAGTLWSAVGANAIFTDVNALAISPGFASDGAIFAGTHGAGVYKSTTGGASWAPSSAGLGNFIVRGMAISPNFTADQTVLAATNGGLFISFNGGLSWNATTITGPSAAAAFAPNFASSRTVFAGTAGVNGRVFQSSDGGSTWAVIEAGFPTTEVVSLTVSPSYGADGNVFAGTASKGLWVYKVTGAAPAGPQATATTESSPAPAVSTSTFGAATVAANLFVVDPTGLNSDLRHNVPNLNVVADGQLRSADFKSFYEKTGALERWGLPISEVFEEESGVLTQYYQRGVVDFHKRPDLGGIWLLERRLTWDYIGGGAGGSADMRTEPTITNPNEGTLLGPWGHKISDYDVAGNLIEFRKFFDRFEGTDAFGFPKTDARVDTGAPGTLLAPGSTVGRVRQYFQAGVMEFFPENPEGFKVQLTLLGDFLRNVSFPQESWRNLAPFQAAGQLTDGGTLTILAVKKA